jgi:BirA family biotin operon repressor/biotin-[acetyl-CoA-carboxylase] ligase
VNIPLLRQIRDAGGTFVPLDQCVGEPADLAELEAFGFVFENHPLQGVAYRGPSPRLCPDQIEFELGTKRIGRRIAVWSRVGSTNDLAAKASSSTANDGLVILAEEQTNGRGRRGRSWTAPRGSSILMSVLLFPPPILQDLGWLTALGAVAVAEVIAEFTGLDARIKWPNDVRVDRKKVAGILVERGQGTVLGIGLNVNVDEFPDELRDSASSLKLLFGQTLDRSEIARALIQRLDFHQARALIDGPESLDPPYRAKSEHLGHRVEVSTASETIEGRLIDVDLRSGLTVESDRLRRFPGADVVQVVNLDGSQARSNSRTVT